MINWLFNFFKNKKNVEIENNLSSNVEEIDKLLNETSNLTFTEDLVVNEHNLENNLSKKQTIDDFLRRSTVSDMVKNKGYNSLQEMTEELSKINAEKKLSLSSEPLNLKNNELQNSINNIISNDLDKERYACKIEKAPHISYIEERSEDNLNEDIEALENNFSNILNTNETVKEIKLLENLIKLQNLLNAANKLTNSNKPLKKKKIKVIKKPSKKVKKS